MLHDLAARSHFFALDVEKTSWWCIDDVIIGRPDMTMNSLHDTFDSPLGEARLNEDHWYHLQGGRMAKFDACGHNTEGLSLVFDSLSGIRTDSFVHIDLLL